MNEFVSTMIGVFGMGCVIAIILVFIAIIIKAVIEVLKNKKEVK